MRDSVTDQEIEDYRRDGFLTIDDLLSPSELAGWRAAVDTAIAEDRATQPDGSNAAVFTQRMNLRTVSAAVRALVEDPGIGRMAADLEGIDAARVYLDQALVKEPFGAPTQYHLDLPWWSFDSDHACTVWVALDDATLENGCLYFAPGSHRWGLARRSDLGPDLGAVFAGRSGVAPAPVPSPLPAGGCTFHNARTIHGAGANMTSGRRRAMTAAFMPDGTRFNGRRDVRVLGTDYLDTLAVGDALRNDELNPVVHPVPAAARHGR